jgi:tetratricopeptide (TPR) repeat protein
VAARAWPSRCTDGCRRYARPVSENDDDIEELFYEGSDLHGEGRHAEALAKFDACLRIDPDYTDALLGKAMVHLARNEFDDAIAYGRRIVELTPDDILAQTNLSVFYQRAGRIAEAEEAAAKAKMLDWKQTIRGGKPG